MVEDDFIFVLVGGLLVSPVPAGRNAQGHRILVVGSHWVGQRGRVGASLFQVAMTLQRCGQPGQQQGRRMPPCILSMPTLMRRSRVASCLADVTQQIHSFRASGVISPHRLLAAALDSMAFRKSAGSSCTVPPPRSFLLMYGTMLFQLIPSDSS